MGAARAPLLLVVDDDAGDRELTREALAEISYPGRIEFVNDGLALLEYLDHAVTTGRDGLPDLIMLDLNMPRMDGFSVLVRLKADDRFSAIPVLILSTSRAPGDVAQAYRVGAQSYLAKPSRFSDLVAAMRTAYQYWFATVSLPDGGGAG
ncbi:MAG: response regulator [Pseudomonadota bacterium]|nr:response regulator [Pseudomonadota bacterium]